MKIVLRVDRGSLRRWHRDLAQRLARRDGAEVGFRFEEGSATPRGAEPLFQIETTLFGIERGVSERIAVEALGGFSDGRDPYLLIDLAAEPLADAERVWRVECDGAGVEPGLMAALLSGRSPKLRVLGPRGPIALARPGAERQGLVRTAFEDMLERVVTLIEAALDGAAVAPPPALPGESAQSFSPEEISIGKWMKRAAATVKRSGVRLVYDALCHSPHWRVGWRRATGSATGGGWTDLPDDGRRFYADPFPVVWGGRTFLFVEELEHATGKGVISVAEFGQQGPLGKPEVALERPGHLSYPNVFERDGEMWMIPESGSAGTIDLFRATAFPYRWTLERTLVSGVCANDATLVEWQGRWWMFATVRDGGAYSDSLWLWSAPDFRGPWTPHKRNPVLIDIATARPAGRMFVAGGAIHRPVQDCRFGYGAALGLARVERLDDDGFGQTLETLVKPGGPDWPGRRLHTYNAAGGFEFIDGSAFAPRWPALRRPLNWRLRRESAPAPA